MLLISPYREDHLRQAFSRQAFEAHAVKQRPILPLGVISINGQFDRYFNPETQATWEGWVAARKAALELLRDADLAAWKWLPRERMLVDLNSDHLQKDAPDANH